MIKQYTRLPFTICFILLICYKVNCSGHFWGRVSCFSNILSYETFQVDFYLSTTNQIQKNLTVENFDSDDVDFDPTRMTVVLVPGLTPNKYLEKMYTLRDEFLEWADVNVIYVDWGKGSPSTLLYIQAVFNTEYAAIEMKKFFSHIIKTWNGTEKSVEHWGPVHFVGLSLGAHVAGQAAKLLKQESGFSVSRITGLDPAEPCFDNPDSPLRLKKSDAQFVDVIHTDGARSKNSRFGILDPIGHIDFYVNGGSEQPGCGFFRSKRTPNIFLIGYHLTVENGICHHLRSIDLFTESLVQAREGNCTFWAHPWDSNHLGTNEPPNEIDSCNPERCIEMGINTNLYRNAIGVYYVATTSESPYCDY